MDIKTTCAFVEFTPWSGAIKLWEIVDSAGMLDELEKHCEGVFDKKELDSTSLNDYLWFEGDAICEALWGRDESWILDHEEQIRNGEDPDEIEAEEEEEA